MYKLLVVDPLEPLALSRRQITGLRYYQSIPATFPTPQPTTILGALGSILGIHLASNLNIDNLEDLDKVSQEINEKLNCSKPILMGPMLQDDSTSKLYIPLNPNLYVDAERVDEILEKTGDYYYINSDKCLEGYKICIETDHLSLIGVSLKRSGVGEDKVTKLGYMYKYPLIIYRDRSTDKVVKLRTVYVLNCKNDTEENVVRMGGESRVAVFKTETIEKPEKYIVERLASPLTNLSKGTYVAISYIPLIPKDPCTLILSKVSVYGLEFIKTMSDIVGIPQSNLNALPKITIERIGLGYSEIVKKRRSSMIALPPGTIIKTSSKDIKTNKFVEILWSIGYATFLKLSE